MLTTRKKPESMSMVRGQLVTFESSQGVKLEGLLFAEPQNGTCIIHVHGSFGNFYSNAFISVMAEFYTRAGLNFLTFNTSAHDGIAEGYRKGKFEYLGGALSSFGECVADIEGAVDFVRSFNSRMILQGHSLGCDRVLHYLIETKVALPFVLLCPCDSYELQQRWIFPETVESQLKRLRATLPEEYPLLPIKEYGIRQGDDWTYPIPISMKALLSIMEGPVYKLIRLRNPARFRINSDCLIYIGGNDRLQTGTVDQMFSYFEERTRSVKRVYDQGGDHMLEPDPASIVDQILKWARPIAQ
ncbi:MAG: hypothetical protein NTU47_04220 [Ignavibacteriales bacterium]|nr:hypothetical protein [Ignavibacteriales bacterium]